MKMLFAAAEHGVLPTSAIRLGIRTLCWSRLRSEYERRRHATRAYVDLLRSSPIAVAQLEANQQHYEVPAEFFELVLGPHLKYSCGIWSDGVTDLESAEAAALAASCQRAQVEDGMRILDLGCGWGSLTLWLARHYPSAEIHALSNSAGQRSYIERTCRERGYSNVSVTTADISRTDRLGTFDRILSIEMFEHMRNYSLLLQKLAGWLTPEGRLFVHIFCHRSLGYLFESEGATNWMGQHFFTGGQMPSYDVFSQFTDDMVVEEQTFLSGTHYAKTAAAWLANLDSHRDEVLVLFEKVYGKSAAERWFHRWRIFFLACEELFDFRQGQEWGVGHYRLAPVPSKT
ncbi:MAG: class I SAM-dependent methyltransferase [Bdellovibrionales bacterium]|nr:class I SAM-dependent methyltransferase [Bdellovibrionales bacterium]